MSEAAIQDLYRKVAALERWRDDMASVERLNVLSAQAWTPRLYDSAGGVSVATYTSRDGTYYRYGKMIWIYGYIVVATISGAAGAGQARIDGLPITPATGFYPLALSRDRVDFNVAPVDFVADINGASSIIQMLQTRDNTAILELPATAIAANFSLAFSGWYPAA